MPGFKLPIDAKRRSCLAELPDIGDVVEEDVGETGSTVAAVEVAGIICL